MRAAIALEAQSNIGSLQPGKLADAVIFPVTSNDPLREILESPLQPKEVWLDGQCI